MAKASGRPVKLVWTREEEFSWAYFRPAGLIEVASGVTRDGQITAWDFHNYNSGSAGIRTLYEIPQQIKFHAVDSPLRRGRIAPPRPITSRETHIDELAQLLKIDPRISQQEPKGRPGLAVLDAAAKAFG